MKATRARGSGGPEFLRYANVDDTVPGPGEVNVDVHAAGANPADIWMRTGAYAIAPAPPDTASGDAGGVIYAAGAGVEGLAIGDGVFVRHRPQPQSDWLLWREGQAQYR